jgi:hypothetical protein
MKNESFYTPYSFTLSCKRGAFLLKTAIVAACLLWCASCVPLLSSKKGDSAEGKASNPGPALVKPKLEKISNGTEEKRDNKSGEQRQAERSQKPEKADQPDKKTPTTTGAGVEQSAKREEGKKKKDPTKEVPREPSDRPGSDKEKDPDKGPSASAKSQLGSDDALATDLTRSDTLFKKHDHAKYSEKIKNKAIDEVNKEATCKYARLCRDTITQEWGLSLYYFQESTYVMVTYVWDEIDEKWKKTFTSERSPVSGWKRHLEFSAGSKECRPLKGSSQ